MIAAAEVYGDGVILCKDEEDRQKKRRQYKDESRCSLFQREREREKKKKKVKNVRGERERETQKI